MKVTVLGCGPSTGVPAIGPDWGACDPGDPRNRRRRASILIESRGKTVLIDTSPDLREQLLDAGVRRLDAVILTHAHADHLHGIDDLRGVNRLMRQAIPLYADAADHSAEIASVVFGYAFDPPVALRRVRSIKPALVPHAIVGPFTRRPACRSRRSPRITGTARRWGFASDALGYSTDVAELDEAAFAALAGIELWVVDCLRYEPHPTHSHLAKTLALDRAGEAAAGDPDPYGQRARLSRAGRASAAGGRARLRRAGDRAARSMRPREHSAMIRLAADCSDRAAVETIVRDAYSQSIIARIGKPPGPMIDDYAALIRRRNGQRARGRAGDGIAAIIVLLPKSDHLLLDNIAVRPDRRGTGLGRRLIAFAESEARRLGYAETAALHPRNDGREYRALHAARFYRNRPRPRWRL